MDMIELLKKTFTWSVDQILGIHPNVACHTLHIHLQAKPISQKPRSMAPNRRIQDNKEINRPLIVNLIKPVSYPQWDLSIILVPKNNGKIKFCVVYTNSIRCALCTFTCYQGFYIQWMQPPSTKDYSSWILSQGITVFHFRKLIRSRKRS